MKNSFETGASENEETIDNRWYDRFKEIGSFEVTDLLVGDGQYRDGQKEQFLSGEIENPTLDYPVLDTLDLDNIENGLIELKKEIIDGESNGLVCQIYRWRLNEKIAEVRMLKATENKNDKKFLRYSEFIYGKPEQNIYLYTIQKVNKLVEQKIGNEDPDISGAAIRLKNIFQNDEVGSLNIEDYKIPVLELGENENGEFTAEEIKLAFEDALEEYQLEGWKVVIDVEGKYTAITTSQENKEIIVPENRKLSYKKLIALIRHEIGTHARRRENGERTKLKLLGLGLDRYLKGEEGIATYEEQKVKGLSDFSGFDSYLPISLAIGVDGHKRNFREVFEIMKDYYFVNSKKKKEEALVAAQDSAWKHCIRTFRGTTCATPGCCFTKDIVYREGNIGVWSVIHDNSGEEKRFFVGKYDPANERHIWILDQLGISEDDLKNLEN